MNKIQIIGAIMLATGKNVEDVALEHGYSKHTFYRAINNETRSKRVQAIISSITGYPAKKLWPDQTQLGQREL